MESKIRKRIFECSENDFDQLALDIFHFQYQNNPVYRSYCDALKVNADQIKEIGSIPFLPIQFFKTKVIKTTAFEPQQIFESSGTTGSINSKHHVKDVLIYEESFFRCFEKFYGKIDNYCIIGLLPSYLERSNASLVYMVKRLIEKSGSQNSGFYLNDFEGLHQTLLNNEAQCIPTILIGVSFALLDFSEKYKMGLKHTIVMETGGMKGRKEEIMRQALHQLLQERLGMTEVHSEYGMTELLSQAYSRKNGIFTTPSWMKILIRSEDDPFEINKKSAKPFINGAVNIIDLANLYSCSFIATDDSGKLYPDGSFEITGRLDHSDMRGCGLMVMNLDES